ncbi:hypothetical protein COCHEDRAFT_1129592 [Bipolaris maydis C5]|uniref:LysM domain-containing protein n=1 Tax=Cochliobolus heterostrophus (strain C5 / ATCC 48332 / race O) TaxID=701091 RepID=M2V5N3_COCH5|nr:hypothetical protein COCHEDRAFT_1129592 [Bipolaris maydis C5]KAJ6214274.1 hypothetical protein PSV09DRAFT_1129592 [Bipolaris maydis]
MKFLLFSSLFTQLFCLGTARFEPPPTTADPSTIKDCTWWFVAKASDTCDQIAPSYGINVEQLVRYNPILATSCTFVDGASYCVEQNFGVPPVDSPPTTVASSTPTTLATSTKFSSTLPATSTTPGNGVVTPQPTQPGMSAKTAPVRRATYDLIFDLTSDLIVDIIIDIIVGLIVDIIVGLIVNYMRIAFG